MDHETVPTPSYRHVAWVYDLLASAYSLGAIDRVKRIHHDLISPGDRVLYAGAGSGKEIVDACRRGAEVTCVEPCPAMANRLHTRLSAVADGFTITPRPIQSIPAEPDYDLVIGHFFLNLFDAETMPRVLAHLCGFVRPGGSMVLADFQPSAKGAGPVDRGLRSVYYRPVNLTGWLLRICALHPVYNYAPLLTEAGLSIESRQSERVLPGLLGLYEVITARRL